MTNNLFDHEPSSTYRLSKVLKYFIQLLFEGVLLSTDRRHNVGRYLPNYRAL